MADESPDGYLSAQTHTPERSLPAQTQTPAFRAGVSRMDRLRQRFWATRVRLFLHLRRDRPATAARKRGR